MTGTYPVGAAVRELGVGLVEEVGQAGVVLHRDLGIGGLITLEAVSSRNPTSNTIHTPAAVALKRGPLTAASYVRASATTWQSPSFGPPTPPEKQKVLPVKIAAR